MDEMRSVGMSTESMEVKSDNGTPDAVNGPEDRYYAYRQTVCAAYMS